MAVPATREAFKDYCMRRLGYPVVDLEVDDEQVEERIDDALAKFRDYHFDGTQHIYYKIYVTQTDIDNQYFTLPDDVIGVTRIFRLTSTSVGNLFDVRYQIHMNDLFNFTSSTFTPYVMAMRHIETIEEIFVGEVPIRFNRLNNKLYCDFTWSTDVPVGTWIIVDAYQVLDPETHSKIWNDPWLKTYTTALIKQQWGNNTKKFESVQMLGGVTLNGQKIWEEANEEIAKLEADLTNSYSLPVFDMMG